MWRKIAGKIFSRYIFVVDGVIIIVFAAFLAAAVDQYLSIRIDSIVLELKGVEARPPRAGTYATHKPSKPLAGGFKPVDGEVILARNFFDSEAGPLDEAGAASQLQAQEGPGAGDGAGESGLPPRCNLKASIVGIFASADPQWSFAALQSDTDTQFLGIGDTLQSYTISDITWEYLLLSPPGSTGKCYLDILGGPLQAAGPAQPPLGVAGSLLSAQAPQPMAGSAQLGDAFQELMDKSITDVSPTEKNIDKSFIDYLKNNKQLLGKSGKAIPNFEGEGVDGYRLFGMRKSSLWSKMGFQNGDVVKSINGVAFKGGDTSFDALLDLKGSSQFVISLSRKGEPFDITYNIK